MTAEQRRRGAVEAIERILNRGGAAEDVLREVVSVLEKLYESVEIRNAELQVRGAPADDHAFLERVSVLISPYCVKSPKVRSTLGE